MFIHKEDKLVNDEMAGKYLLFNERGAHNAFLRQREPERTSAQQKRNGRALYVYRHTM